MATNNGETSSRQSAILCEGEQLARQAVECEFLLPSTTFGWWPSCRSRKKREKDLLKQQQQQKKNRTDHHQVKSCRSDKSKEPKPTSKCHHLRHSIAAEVSCPYSSSYNSKEQKEWNYVAEKWTKQSIKMTIHHHQVLQRKRKKTTSKYLLLHRRHFLNLRFIHCQWEFLLGHL